MSSSSVSEDVLAPSVSEDVLAPSVDVSEISSDVDFPSGMLFTGVSWVSTSEFLICAYARGRVRELGTGVRGWGKAIVTCICCCALCDL